MAVTMPMSDQFGESTMEPDTCHFPWLLFSFSKRILYSPGACCQYLFPSGMVIVALCFLRILPMVSGVREPKGSWLEQGEFVNTHLTNSPPLESSTHCCRVSRE